MKSALLAALLLSAFNVQAATTQTDRQQLEQVVETFRLSLINKDKASFMKLLYSENIPWIGVIKDKSMNMLEDRGDKVNKITPGASAVKFIDSIVSDKEAIEEKFDNVRIDSDGDIAQVYFDYNFNRGDYRSNWGQEAWQLVRTTQGWKINSVIWSMDFNPEKPPKKTP
ncbi:nuclear transport factor 2 family protein [Janthinobacterium sp. RB2R34]|uniref:nuclear transport factor 2 family protein n=1 Tax=Janthinobacterium sp. RB2R34 TaxID=3424193 RepID=UPI003F223001